MVKTANRIVMLLSDIKIYFGILSVVVCVNLAEFNFKQIVNIAFALFFCVLVLLDITERPNLKEGFSDVKGT